MPIRLTNDPKGVVTMPSKPAVQPLQSWETKAFQYDYTASQPYGVLRGSDTADVYSGDTGNTKLFIGIAIGIVVMKIFKF